MGPDGDPEYDGFVPCVGFNPLEMEYWVAWEGDDDTSPLVDNEFEIFLQRTSILTCQSSLFLDGIIASGLYAAEDSISIAGQLDSGAYISANAPEVSLKPGTDMKPGSSALIRSFECPGTPTPLLRDARPPEKLCSKEQTKVDSRKILHLYPNPVKDQLFVELPAGTQYGGIEWRIISLDSKITRTGACLGESLFSINTTKLRPGIYFLELVAPDARWVSRFVKTDR
jgi:hypothetical protein